MKKLSILLRDRRGISMTEVVVAMAVVVIVTGAAISLLIASIRFDAKYRAQTEALNACESAVSCVRFADDAEDLGKYLKKLGFKDSDDGYVLQDGKVTVTVTENSWIVTMDDEDIYEKTPN